MADGREEASWRCGWGHRGYEEVGVDKHLADGAVVAAFGCALAGGSSVHQVRVRPAIAVRAAGRVRSH
jgi:hypothetical protein